MDSERTSVDERLDALAHVQRRRLLLDLLVHNPQDVSSDRVPDEEAVVNTMKQLTARQHVHLPKLEEYGFITWDQEASEVEKGPRFDEIRSLLELLTDYEDELSDDWF